MTNIPDEVERDKDLTVGTMLLGCNGVVSRGNQVAFHSKAHCDTVIGHIVNYSLAKMNMTMSRENKQILDSAKND